MPPPSLRLITHHRETRNYSACCDPRLPASGEQLRGGEGCLPQSASRPLPLLTPSLLTLFHWCPNRTHQAVRAQPPSLSPPFLLLMPHREKRLGLRCLEVVFHIFPVSQDHSLKPSRVNPPGPDCGFYKQKLPHGWHAEVEGPDSPCPEEVKMEETP